jgi:hypothetical protein
MDDGVSCFRDLPVFEQMAQDERDLLPTRERWECEEEGRRVEEER